MESPSSPKPAFSEYCFLELMGHRKLAGLVQEVEIAGGKFLRIDTPDATGKLTTQFYSPASVYCITPTTEAMVKAFADRNSAAPVNRYELTFTETKRAGVGEDVGDQSYQDSEEDP